MRLAQMGRCSSVCGRWTLEIGQWGGGGGGSLLGAWEYGFRLGSAGRNMEDWKGLEWHLDVSEQPSESPTFEFHSTISSTLC